MPFTKVIPLGCGAGWRGEQADPEGPVEAHIHCCMPGAWHGAWHMADAYYVCIELADCDSVLKRMVRLPGSASRSCCRPSHNAVLRPLSKLAVFFSECTHDGYVPLKRVV